MSDNRNSIIVIGVAAAVLLCGLAGAIVLISDSNDTETNENASYKTAYRAEPAAAVAVADNSTPDQTQYFYQMTSTPDIKSVM